VALLATTLLVAQAQPSSDVRLKAAQQKEEVEGDLTGAIELYDTLARSSDRPIAASALLRMAGCYQKLGDGKARQIYDRLVRDYADQRDIVTVARTRLDALARLEQATASPGLQASVRSLPQVDHDNMILRLSRDGTKELFINRDTGYNLAFYDFATAQSKKLTAFPRPDPKIAIGSVYDAAWSQDGRRVAYTWTDFHPDSVSELRVMTLTGETRVIFRNEANPGRGLSVGDCLPDGRTFLVTLERADRTFTIGLVGADDGKFTPLRSLQWTGGTPDHPRSSPDGRFVAFADGPTGMRAIQILSLDGRTALRITDHAADDRQPVWSPDGRHLAFTSTRSGSVALWAVAVADGKPAGEPVRITNGMQDAELVDWTIRGLAYKQTRATNDIYTMSVDRSTWQPVGEPRLAAYPRTGRNVGAAWSPDGRYLAFISGSPTEADRFSLVLVPEGGGDPREFPIPRRVAAYAGSGAPYDLRWFGDSSGLGFSDLDAQGQPAIWHLTLATGQWKIRPLPVTRRTRIEWSADGSKYFYARQLLDGNQGIFERDLETDRERIIYKPSDDWESFRGLSFGPDRRWLAFLTFFRKGDQFTRRARVVNTETGETRTLIEEHPVEDGVEFWTPAWLPDGRTLVVPQTIGAMLPRAGFFTLPELRVASLDGDGVRSLAFDVSSVRRQATSAADLGLSIHYVAWSPDGKRLAFQLSGFQREALLLENVLAGASPTARR
jgi:Tol biopolymer transport system component